MFILGAITLEKDKVTICQTAGTDDAGNLSAQCSSVIFNS